jgi:hypothetical protein
VAAFGGIVEFLMDAADRPGAERPRTILIGGSVELHEIRTVSSLFHLTPADASLFLINLGVPIIRIGPQSYFNLHALERAVFYVTQYHGRGYIPLPDLCAALDDRIPLGLKLGPLSEAEIKECRSPETTRAMSYVRDTRKSNTTRDLYRLIHSLTREGETS